MAAESQTDNGGNAGTPSSQPRVAVVVLNFNGLEDTLRCLHSLRAIPEQILTVLVDNASEVDPIPAALDAYPGLVTMRTTVNLGYAGGNNRGIEIALSRDAEYVLVLNNDTTVDPAIVAALSTALDADPGLGIVGPVVNFMDEPSAVMTDGVQFNPGPGTEFFRRIVVPVGADPAALVPVDIVNGCCMMVRASMLRSVGLFDEQLFIIHEESDLCLRALRRGYRAAVLGRSLVLHKGSSAFERTGRQTQRYYDTRNLVHLLHRHTGHVAHSRPFRQTALHYCLYAYYRYDVEVAAGKPAAARAVAEGFHDGWRGILGPYRHSARWGRAVTRGVLATLRWLKMRRRSGNS